MFSLLFEDKRLLSFALFVWSVLSCAVFAAIMLEDNSSFLHFGPSTETELFGVKLDSWFKWWMLAIYTFLSTCIAAFSSDSVSPWITNTIQDHKTKFIPYSKVVCLMIIQVFTFYAVTQSVIGLFVALTQIDFMLIRLLADMIVNHWTTYWFLKHKTVNSMRYQEQCRHATNANQDILNEDLELERDLLWTEETNDEMQYNNASQKQSLDESSSTA